MIQVHDEEGFGGCTNIGECSAVCPKEISMDFIARMNRDVIRASLARGNGSKRGSEQGG
jgi:succinate dehydrogenase / fumarate reductase iron-sulfur subunit